MNWYDSCSVNPLVEAKPIARSVVDPVGSDRSASQTAVDWLSIHSSDIEAIAGTASRIKARALTAAASAPLEVSGWTGSGVSVTVTVGAGAGAASGSGAEPPAPSKYPATPPTASAPAKPAARSTRRAPRRDEGSGCRAVLREATSPSTGAGACGRRSVH